ncbi:hypothetical protein MIMGU_mgv1a004065mg [Erythranthe guttata]|uniref:DUF668 domain-containing protein n=1 Tax=Erythranthe guttata TaxID=4155 RepID=A0A022RF18_ERYGU|nr:PREDICTED: uncharacterized protein LOC105956738 [Erythranthe guttata]XP_012836084.1 PREDICTED: uncharacterized protein LOC105956738 [Erythranthe guttata]EYU38604.1 hypothetical protein MIMGU_mgv1a004065mg [Erythranthe guttata]|eukprot:XP_012836083.1 PREDICTED: uncharacterized protein LOC105956738 [Erythranthe guttata]
MVGETVINTWFGNIWKSSRISMSWEPERPVPGVLAFEISRLMLKLVNIWQDLADGQLVRFREEIANSVGIHKLVSEDDDFLMDLVLAEIIGKLGSVVKSVGMLGKKCRDPMYHNLEGVFSDVDEIDPKWYGWQYKPKKMEKKVKKMESFVAATEQLYQELEVLAELEQNLRRMRGGGSDTGQVKLLEFQQKVVWQRQEVKNFRQMSPWFRSYDYIVRFLLKFIFTIVERIKNVYGTTQSGNIEGSSDCLIRSNSISAPKQTSVHPSETNLSRFAVPFGRSLSNLGLGCDKKKSKNMKSHSRSQSFIFSGKQHLLKSRLFAPAGFAGCMNSGRESPVLESCKPSCSGSFRPNDTSVKNTKDVRILHGNINSPKVSFFNSKLRLLDAPPSTLGNAALALHYANIIILIEKLAESPHLISLDARDDLYNMLPETIRSCLRAKLKTFSRTLVSSAYDAAFAAEWRLALAKILEWLSPLAHNMVRWQSARNFERKRLIFGSSVNLVQTLYFANQVETDAAIVELLMGLNYLSRFGSEINQKPFQEVTCPRR